MSRLAVAIYNPALGEALVNPMIGLLISLRRFEPGGMRQTSNASACLFLLLLAASPCNAGVSIITSITITTSQVKTYHYMEADSSTAYYYDVEVNGFTVRDSGPGTNYSEINFGYDVGDVSAAKELYNSKTNNRGYIAISHFWLMAFYYYEVNSTIIYEDWLGYGLINPGSYGGSATINAPGGYTEQGSYEIYLGSAAVGDNTYLPVISGINVTGSPVRGGSGYIEVYGTNLAKLAGPTTASISGSGVTASVSHQSPGQVNLSYSISSSATTGGRDLTVTTPFGGSNSKTFTIYGHTPVISSMPHSHWGAGGTTVVEIYGQWFGTNPQVNITGNGVGTPVVDYKSDTQINVRIPTSETAPNGTGVLTVTASNMNGGLFQQQPGGGGAQTSVNASILSKSSFSMKLEKVGFAINAGNNYSEDTEIRVTAVRNANGAALRGWTGVVPIRETSATLIYTQNGGALPSSVTIPYGTGGATMTFLAKSLADRGSLTTPPNNANITTTVTSGSSGFSVYQGTHLAVPQWVISGTTIDTAKLCGSGDGGPGAAPYDWIQRRIKDIFTNSSGDAAIALGAIKCYQVAWISGNQQGIANWGKGQPKSVVVINPYSTKFRTDGPIAYHCGATTAGLSLSHNLKATVLHEGRHAYQASMATVGNDQDRDWLVKPASAYPYAPTGTMIDSTTARTVCDVNQALGMQLITNKTYKGDGIADSEGAPDQVEFAFQFDAIDFSERNE